MECEPPFLQSECVRTTGRSPGLNSGIGFVTYDNPATATAAVEALDGASFMGRSLAVCLAKDRKAKRQPLAPAAGKMPGSASVGPTGARSAPTAPLVVPPDCRSVLVENLVYGCSQRDVRALFKKATKVILLGKLGKARVGFLSAADVREACEQAQGQTSGGRQIRARPELPSEITQDGGHEIFLKYLPKETTEAQLSEFFGVYCSRPDSKIFSGLVRCESSERARARVCVCRSVCRSVRRDCRRRADPRARYSDWTMQRSCLHHLPDRTGHGAGLVLGWL